MDYQSIVESLLDLPNQICSVELGIAELRNGIKMDKQLLEHREVKILTSRGDWGKNDKERKTAQDAAFAADARHMVVTRAIAKAEHNLACEEAELTRLKNLFYAYRSVAELTSAHSLGGRSVAAAANGLATVDITADEIGL
jgi:hypothetical protein